MDYVVAVHLMSFYRRPSFKSFRRAKLFRRVCQINGYRLKIVSAQIRILHRIRVRGFIFIARGRYTFIKIITFARHSYFTGSDVPA